MDPSMAIIIPAHDSHKDVVEVFLKSLEKFYPDCPYEIYWSNCGEMIRDRRVKIIKNNRDSSFCSRLKNALNCIAADYVWLWVEDYIPTRRIQQQEILLDLRYMFKNNCNACRIFKANKRFMKRDRKYPYLYHIAGNMPYGVAINSGIFKREFLQSIIKDDSWNVWELENSCLEMANASLLSGCIYDGRRPGELAHLLYKGKMFKGARRRIEKAGIGLSHIKRDDLPFQESLRVFILSFFGSRCPLVFRKAIKKAVKRMGVKIASEY